MTNISIAVRGLGKRFNLNDTRYRGSLAERLSRAAARALHLPRAETPRETNAFWAVRDVSFDVPQGEVVGIIGRNGSGKSTLMKMLARITAPTEGYAEMCGHVGALLEVGTGFHPDLTGRENIFMSGSILGMSRAQTTRRLDEIVEFSEIGRFIDEPVKHYSSGMFTRLAFAVTAHLEAEIMLIDEVLAVGDAGFQGKALAKIREIVRAGRTVLFISHDMEAIRMLCDWCILMEQGALKQIGDVGACIEAYSTSLGAAPAKPAKRPRKAAAALPNPA